MTLRPLFVSLLVLVACGGGGTAPVKDAGPQGTFKGPLTRGSEVLADHEVVVMTDGQGQPQVGLWEFCNIQLVGGGPYTAAKDSSCLIDLGDGKKPHAVTAEGRFENGAWSVTATFDEGTVWSWKGTR